PVSVALLGEDELERFGRDPKRFGDSQSVRISGDRDERRLDEFLLDEMLADPSIVRVLAWLSLDRAEANGYCLENASIDEFSELVDPSGCSFWCQNEMTAQRLIFDA